MERITSLEEARNIMGHNFIGPDELSTCQKLRVKLPEVIPPICYSQDILKDNKNGYILLLGVSKLENGDPLTIRSLINLFGKDPTLGEPCFYNQDWFMKEGFIDSVLPDGWYLIRKTVFEESRAVMPNELEIKYSFPSAVSCVYAFFTAWICLNERLWWHDFVWCCDRDHNGDRIYVGKYHDIDGVNKNGFSIHRHLALRSCYAAVDSM